MAERYPLGVPDYTYQDRFITPTVQPGTAGLGLSTADPFILGTPTAMPQSTPAIQPLRTAGVGWSDTELLYGRSSQPAPPEEPAQRPETRTEREPLTAPVIAFSPSTNKVVVNGRVFDINDPLNLARGLEFVNATPAPAPSSVAVDWQPLSVEQLTSYIDAQKQPRGTLENIGQGVSTGVEYFVGGLGRTLETQFGAPETGRALAKYAKESFGLTPEQESRNALIQKSNSFAGNLIDAIETGTGSMFVNILGAGIGAGAGLAVTVAGGPAGAMAAGTAIFAGATIFPMEVYGLYDAAKKNGYNVEDPEVQNRILSAGTANTVVQSIVPGALGRTFARVFAPQLNQAAGGILAATRAKLGTTGTIAAGGFTEALAEGTAQFVQSVVFDKELRAKLDPEMKKGLLNYLTQASLDPLTREKYGTDILIATLAGGIIGTGFTAGGVALDRPTDLTKRVPDVFERLRESDQNPLAPEGVKPKYSGDYRDLARAAGLTPPAPRPTPEAEPSTGETVDLRDLFAPPAAPITDAALPPGVRQRSSEAAPIPSPPPSPPSPPSTLPQVSGDVGGFAPPEGMLEPSGPVAVPPKPPGSFEPISSWPPAPAEPPGSFEPISSWPPAPRTPPAIDPRAVRRGVKADAKQYIAEQFNRLDETQQAELLAAIGEDFTAADFANLLADVSSNAEFNTVRRAFNNAALSVGEGIDYFTRTTSGEAALKRGSRTPTGTTAAQPESVTDLDTDPELDEFLIQEQRALTKEIEAATKEVAATVAAGTQAGNPLAGFGVQTLNKADLLAFADRMKTAGFTDLPTPPGNFNNLTKPKYADRLAASLKKNPRAAARLLEGEPSATTQRQQSEDDQSEYTPDEEGRATTETSRGDSTKQGGESTETGTEKVKAAGRKAATKKAATKTAATKTAATKKAPAKKALAKKALAKKAPAKKAPAKKAATGTAATGTAATDTTTDGVKTDDATTAPSEPQVSKEEKRKAFGLGANVTPVKVIELRERINKERDTSTTPEPPGVSGDLNDPAVRNRLVDRLIKYAEDNKIAGRLVDPGTPYLNRLIQTKAEKGGTFRLPPSVAQQVDTVTDVLDTNNKPVKPMAPGRIRMDVKNFVRKLQRKPKVAVYANQADLKLKAPDIYKRAAASRPGDFDTVNAAAISFGDEIVVFSDRIATPQMLRFVMAHESLGHFGLRSLVPAKDFNSVMELIYDTDSKARDAADARMSLYPDMSKSEAVEEYLSDYAASLESNVILRVFNGFKKFLGKLGVGFDDATTRYLLDQSRRYVRYGQDINVAQMSEIVQRAAYIETGAGPEYTGRFAPAGNVITDGHRLAATARETMEGVLPADFEGALQSTRRYLGNTQASVDAFFKKYVTLTGFRSLNNDGLRRLNDISKETEMRAKTLRTEANNALSGSLYSLPTRLQKHFGSLIYSAREYNVVENKFGAEFDKMRFVKVGPDLTFRLDPTGADAIAKMGFITKEQAYNGFDVRTEVNEDGEKTTPVAYRFAGLNNLGLKDKEKDLIYKSYVESLEVMNKLAMEKTLSLYNSMYDAKLIKLREISEVMFDGRDMSDQQIAFFDKYTDLYTKLLDSSIGNAEKFLKQVNQAFLSDPNKIKKGEEDWMATLEQTELVDAKDRDELVKLLKAFKKTSPNYTDAKKFTIQNAVTSLGTIAQGARESERTAKQGIATGHVSLIREGGYEVRVRAIDPKSGKSIVLPTEVQDRLVYAQFTTSKDAMDFADSLNKGLTDPVYELPYVSDTGVMERGKFKLQATAATVIAEARATPYQNYNEFKRTLDLMNIKLPPQVTEEITKRLTRQGDAVRKRLRAAFTPGADLAKAKASISRKINSEVSIAAKNRYRSQFEEVMNLDLAASRKMWFGDSQKIMDLYKQLQTAKKGNNKDLISSIETEFAIALYRYKSTNPAAKDWDGSPDKFRKTYEPGDAPELGGQYYDEGRNFVGHLEGNRDVLQSDTFINKPKLAALQMFAGIVQLGGVLAHAPLNIMALITHVMPFLASQNSKTGFGGGFGSKAISEALKTFATIDAPRVFSKEYNSVEYFDGLLKDDAALKKSGLKRHEVQFLRDAITSGQLIPAQSDAILASAQGMISSPGLRKFIDTYMLAFNRSEEMVRRVTGLTAFRLEYNKQIAAGKSKTDAYDIARKFAQDTLDFTLGDYNYSNRPPAWRHGVPALLFMYKTFIFTSFQLMKRMDMKGRAGMIVMLFLLTGIKGMPFAEDIEDLLDTMLQKSGMGASVSVEASKIIDDILPGWSPFMLRGLVNQMVPGDVAAKFSLGNIVPGTSILLAGSSPQREFEEVIGPAFAAGLGLVSTGVDLASYPFSSGKNLSDIARSSPVTLGRILGDLYQYKDNGAITDKRGYVVAPDVTTGEMLWRLGGFYPKRASKQYDMIKYYKRVSDYQRLTSSNFQNAWVRARISGDSAAASEILQTVREWNRTYRGTGLEIKNFMPKAQRRLKLARMPAGERTLKSLPKNVREAEDAYIRAMIGDEE